MTFETASTNSSCKTLILSNACYVLFFKLRITVQTYFEKRGVTQEFCKPATPQQNTHIERAICQQYEFKTLLESQQTFNRFVQFYNFERIYSGVNHQAPYDYLLELELDLSSFEAHISMDCASLHQKAKLQTKSEAVRRKKYYK